MKEIDVRGLSCPEPVLIVQKELKQESNEEYKILANEAHTVKNIENFLNNLRKSYSIVKKDVEYEIIIK